MSEEFATASDFHKGMLIAAGIVATIIVVKVGQSVLYKTRRTLRKIK